MHLDGAINFLVIETDNAGKLPTCKLILDNYSCLKMAAISNNLNCDIDGFVGAIKKRFQFPLTKYTITLRST